MRGVLNNRWQVDNQLCCEQRLMLMTNYTRTRMCRESVGDSKCTDYDDDYCHGTKL